LPPSPVVPNLWLLVLILLLLITTLEIKKSDFGLRMVILYYCVNCWSVANWYFQKKVVLWLNASSETFHSWCICSLWYNPIFA
jgi:hypothetical protein